MKKTPTELEREPDDWVDDQLFILEERAKKQEKDIQDAKSGTPSDLDSLPTRAALYGPGGERLPRGEM